MGGPALRCATGKSNRARCFQRVALSTAPFFCVKGVRPESPGSNLAAIGKQLFLSFRCRDEQRDDAREAAREAAGTRRAGLMRDACRPGARQPR